MNGATPPAPCTPPGGQGVSTRLRTVIGVLSENEQDTHLVTLLPDGLLQVICTWWNRSFPVVKNDKNAEEFEGLRTETVVEAVTVPGVNAGRENVAPPFGRSVVAVC